MIQTNYTNITEFPNDLESIKNTISNATPKVSFWGTRTISYQTQEFTLNDVADKVSTIADKGRYDFSRQERLDGIGISRKIENLYEETDTLISQANWFTKLLVFFKEFRFSPFPTMDSPRDFYEIHFERTLSNFKSITEEKYIYIFGDKYTSSGLARIGCHTTSIDHSGTRYVVLFDEKVTELPQDDS